MGLFGRLGEDILNTFVSIMKGHRVTWRNLWRERVTLQYPDQRPVIPERFRGIPGVHPELCIVCGSCARACPVQVITIEGKRIEGTRYRELTKFQIEAGRCMFCGLCEEACPAKPVKAIRLSHVYELASFNKASLVFDLPVLYEIWKSKPVDVPEEEYLASSPRRLAERERAKAVVGGSVPAGDRAPAASGGNATASNEGSAGRAALKKGSTAPADEGKPLAGS